jgi:hypothetical protein
LRLDFDAGVPVPPTREIAFRVMRAGFALVQLAKRRSPSGTGWHLVARVRPRPSPIETVALQAICGSDPHREGCNLRRARTLPRLRRSHGSAPPWNVLYVKVSR